MLLAFLAMIAMLNALLGWSGGWRGSRDCRWKGSWVGCWAGGGVMGVPADAVPVGSLMGLKTVANEFVAFLGLAEEMGQGTLSARSATIATYALSGFANFSSIAIQIGGTAGSRPPEGRTLRGWVCGR